MSDLDRTDHPSDTTQDPARAVPPAHQAPTVPESDPARTSAPAPDGPSDPTQQPGVSSAPTDSSASYHIPHVPDTFPSAPVFDTAQADDDEEHSAAEAGNADEDTPQMDGADEADGAPTVTAIPPAASENAALPQTADTSDPSETRQTPDATGNFAEEDLERTAVRRRSLIAPVQPAPAQPAAEWRPRESLAPEQPTPTVLDRSFDSHIYEGATIVPTVPKRGTWHVLSVLITLIVAPIACLLAEDAAVRLGTNIALIDTAGAGATSFFATYGPALELLGVVALLVVTVELAVKSSLGAHVIGIVLTILGLPWLVVPSITAHTLYPAVASLFGQGTFGQNIGHHLQAAGYSGRLLLLGVGLWALGAVSHRVRRRGRAEQSIREEVARMNPTEQAPTTGHRH